MGCGYKALYVLIVHELPEHARKNAGGHGYR